MYYPIFSSIVHTIDTRLEKLGIKAEKFSTWENNKINATGLELEISLSKLSQFMKSLSINFDWDSFRESALARRLEGMESHPFLKIEKLNESEVPPSIDIEMTWLFDIEKCQPELPGESGNYRIEKASQWMESISKRVNEILKDENIITRWHIEIEGDQNGRYLSAINLISYFQYQFETPKSVNDVKQLVEKALQELLLKAKRVIYLSDETLQKTIAA